MGKFGLKSQSLFHLGLCRFLRSAQHDGNVDHQTQQGGAILQSQRERGMQKIPKLEGNYLGPFFSTNPRILTLIRPLLLASYTVLARYHIVA